MNPLQTKGHHAGEKLADLLDAASLVPGIPCDPQSTYPVVDAIGEFAAELALDRLFKLINHTIKQTDAKTDGQTPKPKDPEP